MITDGDGDVELRTGTTASSTKRDLLIVEYTQASIRAYIKHKKGDGSEAIQTGSGNLSYPPTENFFKKYYDMCEKFNHPTYNHVTFATGTFDNSNIAY